jgi:carboxymethylenebutenolidase
MGMNDVNAYLTGEVIVDYSDGLISRREATRRLVLLGVGTAVAGTMLAACDQPASRPTTAPDTTGKPSAAANPVEPVTFGSLSGSWSAATGSARGAVLIIHENRGLTDHFVALPGRFAASGYSALAVDLLSEEGGTAHFTDSAQATAALNAASPDRFVRDMRAGLDELAKRVPGAKAGIVGFCFGGGQVWSLLNAGEPRLYAAAPFYGPTPANPNFSGSPNASVLAIYGEQDDRVNATRDAARTALEAADLRHEIVTYPGANHAFFNDTGPRYNPQAATAAYAKLMEWFGRYLA